MSTASTGRTDSIWMKTAQLPATKALTSDAQADVCVVGAGIAGLTTAYLLGRAGLSVIVLESLSQIGGGETGRTTAHLSFALDDRYTNLEKLFGEVGSRMAAESHRAAVDRIEQIATSEQIDCDFTRLDGYLFVPPGDSVDQLHGELEAARRAGLANVKLVDRAPLSSFNTGVCLQFPGQAQFHPLKYLAGLARAIERDGGRIYSGMHGKSFKGGPQAKVETKQGASVSAKHLVVATNTPVNDRVTMHTKQAAYRTYAIGARVRRGSIPLALYWDTADPYHYVRLQSVDVDTEHDVLIVGGEDHKTGQGEPSPERFDRLEAWTRERFPITGIEFRWSGQVLEPVDSLGFIGRNPGDEENVYIITGDSGHGMTNCTIGGILITDLIQGRDNSWAKLYDPARVSLRASGEFLKENLNVAAEYGKWLTGGELSSADEIPPGEGAVLRRGTTKVAVFRDAHGIVSERTAVCPHLGCIVAWNRVEKSWDCPCHGSRWTNQGEIINGPAISNLEPVK